jgi:hypothetical protein
MRRQPFNGWIAATSVAAACCVLVAYAVTYQSPQHFLVDDMSTFQGGAVQVGMPNGQLEASPSYEFDSGIAIPFAPQWESNPMVHPPQPRHDLRLHRGEP